MPAARTSRSSSTLAQTTTSTARPTWPIATSSATSPTPKRTTAGDQLQHHPEQRHVHGPERLRHGDLLDGHRPQLRPEEPPHRRQGHEREERHRPHHSAGHRVLPRLEPRQPRLHRGLRHRQQPGHRQLGRLPRRRQLQRLVPVGSRRTSRAPTTARASTSTTAPTTTPSSPTTSRRSTTASRSCRPTPPATSSANNIIGVSPTGDSAPMTGWGMVIRWGAQHETIRSNTIRNAGKGGIGLLNTMNNGKATSVAYYVRITRNMVTDTTGPAIGLFGTPMTTRICRRRPSRRPAPTPSRARLLRAPRLELYRATRAVGQLGLPSAYIDSATVAPGGAWTISATPERGRHASPRCRSSPTTTRPSSRRT